METSQGQIQGDEWSQRIPLRSYLQENFDGRNLLTQFIFYHRAARPFRSHLIFATMKVENMQEIRTQNCKSKYKHVM